MERVNIYDELTANLPDGFHMMTDAEMDNMFKSRVEGRKAMLCPEKHLLFAFNVKKYGWLASKLASAKAVRIRYEVTLCRTNPGLKIAGEYNLKVSGVDACGFTYAFKTPEGKNYTVDILSFIKGRKCYAVTMNVLSDNYEEARQICRRLAESIQIQ